MEKLSINVKIAERSYPLRIERKDEERIRQAARLINDKILQYKQRYSDKDIQDFLAMASLQYVIKALELENTQDSSPIIDALDVLDNKLNEVLFEK